MKNTVKITREELVKMLMDWNYGAQPAVIQSVTEPKIKAAGKAIYGTITKIGAVNCMLGFNYEAAVKRQLKREGKDPNTFEAKPIWHGKGERINSRLVRHTGTGELYISYKYERSLKAFHFDSVLNFIPKSILSNYFYASSNRSQGTDKEIKIRMMKIANIRKIKFKKTTYEIINAGHAI